MASDLSGFSISLFDVAQSAMSPTQSEIFAEARRLQQANMSHRLERHHHFYLFIYFYYYYTIR